MLTFGVCYMRTNWKCFISSKSSGLRKRPILAIWTLKVWVFLNKKWAKDVQVNKIDTVPTYLTFSPYKKESRMKYVSLTPTLSGQVFRLQLYTRNLSGKWERRYILWLMGGGWDGIGVELSANWWWKLSTFYLVHWVECVGGYFPISQMIFFGDGWMCFDILKREGWLISNFTKYEASFAMMKFSTSNRCKIQA